MLRSDLQRSDINRLIEEAMEEFGRKGFILPAWAYWDLKKWDENRELAEDIRKEELGWRVSDFNSGRFEAYGGGFFTLSNAALDSDGSRKDIDQMHSVKYIYRKGGQKAPLHFHWSKREEYLNYGDGITTIVLYNRASENEIDTKSPVEVKINHIWQAVAAGTPVEIPSASSIYIPRRTIHAYGTKKGSTVAVETASRNNDNKDNHWVENDDGRIGTYSEPVENLLTYHSMGRVFPQLNELPGTEKFEYLLALYCS